MKRSMFAAVVCLAPFAALAQTTDRGGAPAPVPAVPPPTTQTGGATVPPEQIAPAMKGSVGGTPDSSVEHMPTNSQNR